jgi:hypothetical protein
VAKATVRQLTGVVNVRVGNGAFCLPGETAHAGAGEIEDNVVATLVYQRWAGLAAGTVDLATQVLWLVPSTT